MSGGCVACGGDVAEDATRCPSCGLVFGAAGEHDPLAPVPEPAHVSLYLGGAPRTVAVPREDVAVAAEVPEPRHPFESHERKVGRARRWIVLPFVAAAAITGIVVLVGPPRPDDQFTAWERAFERFEDAAGLDAPDLPLPVDPDTVIASIGDAELRRTATAAHRPYGEAERASIHALFDGYLERLLEIEPDFAFRLGVHPHPRSVGDVTDAADVRWLLLCRDTAQLLRAWPNADRLAAHDRADRAALLDRMDLVLHWRDTSDLDFLDRIDRWFDPLVGLREIACCPAADRVAAATARLDELPRSLASIVGRLEAPPRSRVLATATNVEMAEGYLATYATGWNDVPESAQKRLRSAIQSARSALADCARRLREEVAPKARGDLALGAENVAFVLKFQHRLPFDARTLYERALEELRAASDEMRASRGRPRRRLPAGGDVSFDDQIAELRAGCTAWISPVPADAGVVVRSTPKLWAAQHGGASYLDPGTLDGPSVGVVHMDAAPAESDAVKFEYARFVRRHCLAHESYPGHRLQAVASRAACRLRRFIDDRMLIEGWAVYAVELLHETGGCAGGGFDDYELASRRQATAIEVLSALLTATGTLGEAELLKLLVECGWADAAPEDVGFRAAQGLDPMHYLVGRAEVVRLRHIEESRLGSAFDLRAFHAKLLAAGPISPRLIEEEWAAEGR